MISQPPQPNYELEEEAWWVERWVDLLNQYRFKKRLERGRRYAREGNILSLEQKAAKVTALVQGTADEPYHLSIWLDAFTDEDWTYVIDSLAAQALFSAQLLAGEMPSDIEAVFTSNGLSLFPFTLADVHSRCSCPDPKNPCKHIAAVYYQLGDFFREDPFVLFQLRGRTKEQILEALRQQRQQAIGETVEGSNKTEEKVSSAADTEDNLTPENVAVKNVAAEKIPASVAIESFWQYDDPIDPSLVVITPAEQTVLEVIGDMPLAATEAQVVMEHFKTLYQTVAQQAMITALS